MKKIIFFFSIFITQTFLAQEKFTIGNFEYYKTLDSSFYKNIMIKQNNLYFAKDKKFVATFVGEQENVFGKIRPIPNKKIMIEVIINKPTFVLKDKIDSTYYFYKQNKDGFFVQKKYSESFKNGKSLGKKPIIFLNRKQSEIFLESLK